MRTMRQCRGALILQDDSACPHHGNVVNTLFINKEHAGWSMSGQLALLTLDLWNMNGGELGCSVHRSHLAPYDLGMQAALLWERNAMPQAVIRNLVWNMRARCKEGIGSRGGYIRY